MWGSQKGLRTPAVCPHSRACANRQLSSQLSDSSGYFYLRKDTPMQNSIQRFSPILATKVGIVSASIAEYIHANQDIDFDGYLWARISVENISKDLQYLSKGQIETALNKLIKQNYLIKKNNNKSKLDRTSWYALTSAYYDLIGGGK